MEASRATTADALAARRRPPGPRRLRHADQAEGAVAAAADDGDDDVRGRRPVAGAGAADLLGGSLSAGGAGAVNHYYDRDIDAQMARTATRPVPSGRVSPARGAGLRPRAAALSFLLLAVTVNVLSAVLALRGFLGYVLRLHDVAQAPTPQNIVIGGAAGAVPPLVGWAAVTGALDPAALYLFAIVFYWTPPHFWALSLLMKDEYARVGVPMMPVVRGEDETRRQIVLYTVPARRADAAAGRVRLLRRDLRRLRASVLGARVPGARGAPAAPRRPRAARCAPTSSRSPTSRVLFGAMVLDARLLG